MAKFLHYLPPNISLEARLHQVFDELQLSLDQRDGITAFMQPLRIKDPATYDHSIRVGLLMYEITRFQHMDQKAGFYSGVLHDIGKSMTRSSTLKKTDGWTPADTAEIKGHVMDGYRLLRDHFDFTAEIILWHHRYQPNGYPVELPNPLHSYSEATNTMIRMYGRHLSLADCFDALHRVNDKFGGETLSGKQIKEKMLAFNKDQVILIEQLYKAGIFTEFIVEETATV